MKAVAEGRISPGEAQSVSKVLSDYAQTMQRVDDELCIAELEKHVTEMQEYQRQVCFDENLRRSQDREADEKAEGFKE